MSSDKRFLNGIEIDTKLAQKMLLNIIKEEKKNVQSKNATTSEMILKIKKIIEEEAKC